MSCPRLAVALWKHAFSHRTPARAPTATKLDNYNNKSRTTMADVKKSLAEMTDEERAEEMRRRDAEKLAARKKKFDASRFAHIEKANAENQVRSVDFQKEHEAKKIPGARVPAFASSKTTATTASEPPPEVDEATKEKQNRWKFFNRKRREEEIAKEREAERALREAVKPPPPVGGRNARPTNVRNEVQPGWAGVEKELQQPKPVVHSSAANCSGLARGADMEAGNGAKVPYIPHKNPEFQTVGYGSQGRPTSSSGDVVGSVTNMFNINAKPQPKGPPRNMAKAKVVVSQSESIDAQGKVVKTVTRHITEPDGTKRTETEVVDAPARKFGSAK